MGFGQLLEDQVKPSERHNYVRYGAFKERILAMRAKGGVKKDVAAREALAKDFESEVKRLARFASASVEDLWMRVDVAHGELPADAKDPKAQKISLYRIQDIEASLDDLGKQILSLRDFMNLNREAFAQISDKFETLMAESGVRGAARRLATDDFDAKCADVESLVETFLVLLSDLYARARRVRLNKDGGDAVWVPPESFQRKTTKYWVKTEDLPKVKFEIIKHLPLLIFGRNQGGKETAASGQKLSFMASNTEEILRDSQKISSVYFDTPDLQVYHNRLLRHDFASLVRVRWYGERDQSPTFPLFVERKVHREFWTGNKSVKERCGVNQGEYSLSLSLPLRDAFSKLTTTVSLDRFVTFRAHSIRAQRRKAPSQHEERGEELRALGVDSRVSRSLWQGQEAGAHGQNPVHALCLPGGNQQCRQVSKSHSNKPSRTRDSPSCSLKTDSKTHQSLNFKFQFFKGSRSTRSSR